MKIDYMALMRYKLLRFNNQVQTSMNKSAQQIDASGGLTPAADLRRWALTRRQALKNCRFSSARLT
jgi:hypothetical protein